MDRNPANATLPFPGLAAALMPLALLASCASPAGDYPSLAIRDAERVSGTIAPAAPAYVPPAPSAATLGRLDALAEAAQRAHSAFLAEAPRATSVVNNARGAVVGSENWARAEVALASLIAARSQTMVPLADIDRLYVDAAVEGAALAPIATVRDQVQAHVADEDAAIARLSGEIAR